MRTTIGQTELDRQTARDLWNAQNPKRPAVAVQWAGGDLWQIVCLSGPCGFVDLTPPPEPLRQFALEGFATQGELF